MVGEFERICERHSDPLVRAVVMNIKVGWHIEAEDVVPGEEQSGKVIRIIYDRYKVPVCYEIMSDDGVTDFIAADRVCSYEGNMYLDCLEEYMTRNEIREMYRDIGKTGDWLDGDEEDEYDDDLEEDEE